MNGCHWASGIDQLGSNGERSYMHLILGGGEYQGCPFYSLRILASEPFSPLEGKGGEGKLKGRKSYDHCDSMVMYYQLVAVENSGKMGNRVHRTWGDCLHVFQVAVLESRHGQNHCRSTFRSMSLRDLF